MLTLTPKKLETVATINPGLHSILLKWPNKDAGGNPVMEVSEYTELMGLHPAPPPVEMPPIATQIGNAVGAAARAIKAAVKSQPVLVSDEEMRARLVKCIPCEHCTMPSLRCNLCSCWTAGLAGKCRIATESCPLPEPKWTAIAPPTA